MSKLLGHALVVALVAWCWSAFGPAGAAPALGRPCAGSDIHVAIVVDFGDVMSTTSTCIAAGDRDKGADILAARAKALGTTAPRFDLSQGGLLCAIDGYPETGCGEQSGSTYAYWSYWHGHDGSWEYSSFGPGTWRVDADYVEGWRWQPAGRESAVPPPRADPNAAATCVPAPPPTEPPAPTPITVGAAATPTTAPAAPTTARPTARAGTPTTIAPVAATAPPLVLETTAPTAAPPPASTTTDAERDTQDIAALSADNDSDDGGGGAPVGLILGVVLIAAIGGGAFLVQRRRASP